MNTAALITPHLTIALEDASSARRRFCLKPVSPPRTTFVGGWGRTGHRGGSLERIAVDHSITRSSTPGPLTKVLGGWLAGPLQLELCDYRPECRVASHASFRLEMLEAWRAANLVALLRCRPGAPPPPDGLAVIGSSPHRPPSRSLPPRMRLDSKGDLSGSCLPLADRSKSGDGASQRSCASVSGEYRSPLRSHPARLARALPNSSWGAEARFTTSASDA